MSRLSVGFQYFLASGWCAFAFSLFFFLPVDVQLAVIRWGPSPYALLLVMGAASILLLHLFDRLPKKPFVISGALCWALAGMIGVLAFW
jgi:hypothetical protein